MVAARLQKLSKGCFKSSINCIEDKDGKINFSLWMLLESRFREE